MEWDRPAARRTHRHDRRLANLREALSLCVEMQAANPGKWWWPAARHCAGCRRFARDDPAKMCIGTRGVLYIIRGVLDGHPPAPMAPAFRSRSDRDVGSAVSAASSRFASRSGVRINPVPDRVHADVVGGVLQLTRMERARLRPPSPIERGRSSRSAAAPMSCGPCSARSRGRTPRGGLREDPEPSPRSGSPAPSQDVPR